MTTEKKPQSEKGATSKPPSGDAPPSR
ncbi:MarR family transcriptional regulator, partial [Mesorhizobium sp. M7A.F.Ca.US.014.04.1.1]